MKKILLGLIIGLVVMIPASAFAWNLKQQAQPFIGFDCDGPYYYTSDGKYYADKNGNKLDNYANPIKDPNPNNHNGRCSGNVYVFNDGNTRCYIAKATGTAISCVNQ